MSDPTRQSPWADVGTILGVVGALVALAAMANYRAMFSEPSFMTASYAEAAQHFRETAAADRLRNWAWLLGLGASSLGTAAAYALGGGGRARLPLLLLIIALVATGWVVLSPPQISSL